MADLVFHAPQQVLFGLDTVNRIATLVSPYGERILVVTEAILYEQNTINRIQDLLTRKGIESIVYDEVVPNATSTCVDEGVRLARSAHIDVVVGLGGIRALSTAKCIAMTAPHEFEVDELLSGEEPKKEPVPYIEIPTTCRNPFMMVDRYLMVDARDRRAVIGNTQKGITKAVLIDPKLSLTLPAKFTATTLLNTFLNAVEGYISVKSNFLSDTLFCKAIEIVGKNISEAVENLEGPRVRADASRAGLLTALGLSTSSAGIGTALSYSINARFMVPKSWIATILIPHILEFNTSSSVEKVAHIGSLFGEDLREYTTVDAANKTTESIRSLIASLQLPTRLRDFDLQLDDMVDVVEMAHSFDMMNFLPRTVSTEDLYDIVKSAF
jgi:alcohol dehydrogenase class IV